MKTTLILILSAAALSSAAEKRGTQYLTKPQQPYSFSHFQQELPASEGLLKLLPTVQNTSPGLQQQVAIVPLYIERHVPVPVQQLPLLSKVPLIYQYHGEEDSKPNTFPHLRPYYKQVDQ